MVGRRRLAIAVCVALLADAVAQEPRPAWNEPAPAGAGTEAQVKELDEIIVTAQRRGQRLIDVPASVAAVDEGAMRDLSVRQVSDLANHVPNLAIDATTSLNSAVYIRGVGANSRNIGFDTRVGVYLDGVYLGQSPALNQELLDLERVEVLRGPQGALFGKNTVAGAINLISRQPEFGREIQLGLRTGNYDNREATARFNLPLSDTVAARLSFNRGKRDGFTTNLFDGSTVGDRDVGSWRGQLRWDAGERLRLNLSADGLHAREAGEYGNAFTDTFGSALSEGYLRPRTVDLNHRNRDQRDVVGAALDASYRLDGGGTFKSISAWRSTRFFSTNDLDYSPLDFLSIDFDDEYEQATQEFQWLSGEGGRLEYVAGVYLYRQDSQSRRTARLGALAPLLGVEPGTTLPTDGDLRTRNAAVYGNVEYRLAERVKLGAGLRWSWEDKRAGYVIDGSTIPALGLATGSFRDSRSDRDISPTLALSYEFTPNLVGFLRHAHGYKSGGYNLDFVGANAFPDGLEFDKETAKSLEAGIKGSVWNRSLNFSATAFHTVFEDYQVDQFQDMGEVVAIVIGNASEVRSRGIELEGSLRASERLDLTASLGLQDVEFTAFPGGGALGSDASGRRVPGASRVQASLGANYYIPLGANLELQLHGDYSHRGAYYSDIANASEIVVGGAAVPFDRVPATSYFNARVVLGHLAQDWELALWGRNVFGEDAVFIYGGDFFGTRTRRYAPPRTWGLELNLRF